MPHPPQPRLAALGAFYAIEKREGNDWRPIADLVSGPALGERVTWTREALSGRAGVDVEERVAASTASLGFFARLLSPVCGAVLLGVEAPQVDALWWQPADGGPLRLAADTWGEPDPAAVLSGVISPLVDRLADEHGVSTQVLWGNAASAAHGAVRMAVQADHSLGRRGLRLVERLFALPELAGTADLGPPFVRRSCCLYYRLPGGGYCGDCVLAHP
jgi:hypothetical protein